MLLVFFFDAVFDLGVNLHFQLVIVLRHLTLDLQGCLSQVRCILAHLAIVAVVTLVEDIASVLQNGLVSWRAARAKTV